MCVLGIPQLFVALYVCTEKNTCKPVNTTTPGLVVFYQNQRTIQAAGDIIRSQEPGPG